MPESDLQRRRLLRAGLTSALIGVPLTDAVAATIVAVRVWPATDHTRVTLELNRAVSARHQLLANPNRLVVELDDVDVNGYIRALVAKVRPDDPYIRAVRVGHSPTGSAQLIFDLKTAIKPDLFNLAPVAQYRHRLVIDLHPHSPSDPLVSLLNDQIADEIRTADPLAGLIARKDKKRALNVTTEVRKPKRKTVRRKRGEPAPINRLITVAIDAGHGGEDPGALGALGTYEKNVVLPIAAELRALIRREKGMRAYMTREGDYFVPLQNRVEKARRVAADLFISIHADAAERKEATGASVYVLSASGTTSAAARWLATQENRSDRIGGVKVKSGFDLQARRLLMEMSALRRARDSERLGSKVLKRIDAISPLHKRAVEKADFMVLKTPDIPSILVETAFLSNPDDEARLRSASYQREMAMAIYSGIRDFLSTDIIRTARSGS